MRRPDVRRAESDLHAATARVGVAVANLFPRFSITGAFGTAGDDAGNPRLGQALLVDRPSFCAPLHRRAPQAADRAGGAAACRSFLVYKESVLVALREVETALDAFTREQERRKLLTDAVAANRRAVDLSPQHYGSAKTDFLNVLSAQRSLYLTEDAVVESDPHRAEPRRALQGAGRRLDGVPEPCP